MLFGRKSKKPAGEPHLGKGKTRAVFQAEGNVEVVIEKLNKWIITERMWGRIIFKNLSENPSAPTASEPILIIAAKTSSSSTHQKAKLSKISCDNERKMHGRKMHVKLIWRKGWHIVWWLLS
jgi:hypothetical protein